MNAEYSYNPHHLIKNGKPWFPVMGEIHYTRYRPAYWEESLRKMKAGGVNIVASYIIWIHHEEEEGVFDFTSCRNLRKFLELCQNVGMEVFLRLGPWVHGEVRNGGFPDWIMDKGKEGVALRTNDEKYLAYTTRFWKEVYKQVDGFLLHQGGPVIGVQIENEYGHVGGEEGDVHIRKLTEIAKEIGFQVPLYTATGWGGASIGDLVPVMGGYCDAPWDPRIVELEASPNFVFSHIRNDALIACDHHIEERVSFDESKFPFLTAELGGGIQVTQHRRPIATGKDTGAMSLTKLGCGVALLGYYMYHGGSNPKGKRSTLQESRATGYANDLPEINYDFNAPIRQYGGISDNYREIKLLAYFLKEFGEDFAALESEIGTAGIKPEDLKSLRLAYRHDQTHGYVFFNNYQRRRKMADHFQVELKGMYDGKEIAFPPVDILNESYGFFPYNMQLGDCVLTSATATPLCSVQTAKEKVYIFYGEWQPSFKWIEGQAAPTLHLSRADALNAWKVSMDQEYLIISNNYVWEEAETVKITGGEKTRIKCFPKLTKEIEGFVEAGSEGEFTIYERNIHMGETKLEVKELEAKAASRSYELSICYPRNPELKIGQDVILSLSYEGESMEIYCKDDKINDHFYTGQEVPIRLGYFGFPEELRIVINELKEDDKIYMEQWPKLKDGKVCQLKKSSIRYEMN